jgi:hypothetical protein
MRKRIKEKRKGPHLDRDLRDKRKKARRYGDVGRQQLRDAREASKSASLLGTDGIEYSGPTRRQYNMSRINRYRERTRTAEVNAEQAKRDARRNRQSLNIRQRQKRKKRR